MKKLDVYFCGWGQHWLFGTLAHAGRRLLFEYSDQTLEQGIQFSPLKLPLRKAAFSDFPLTQEGLPGLIADSLPDGWGRILMDRCFLKAGRKLADISPLDRLAFIHDRAMGAFVFRPADELSEEPEYLSLIELAESAQLVLSGKDTDTLKQLALTGGSPHGARPKVLVQYDRRSETVSTSVSAPGTPWMVKFQAEGELKEVCALEVVYSQLARRCCLDMPATQYFDLSKKLAGFGIERFDRRGGLRVPTLSLAALLDDNFRLPSQDYETLLKATRMLTKDEREVRKAFERCVFNVVFNNRDDHTKNFAYVMNETMEWKLAPCYDLTYNVGPGGEHQMTVCGEGRYPGRGHLLELARRCDLTQNWARKTIDHIAGEAEHFASDASSWPISRKKIKEVQGAIEANRVRMYE